MPVRLAQNTPLRQSGQRYPSARAAFAPGDASGGGPAARATGLYIHVPFCFHKCHYCDFYSFVDTRDRQGPFVERLERELEAQSPWAAGGVIETIFVGGGTPSLLRVELWERLLSRMGARLEIGPGTEFTVECNPETVTPELMGALRAGGVNRVSVGAQSFEAAHLKTLERWHDPENVARAIELARAAGIERQSVDLIYAIPGQTLDEWRRDLERAAALGTGHVSCYNLTYESNTAMTARLKRGEFEPAPEELEVEMFELAAEVLGAAGLGRYEVSNYARAGEEARHNLGYWRQASWLACGPSASGHRVATAEGDARPAGWRWKNVPRLDDYLAHDDGGFAPATDLEPPDAARLLRETLMTGVRLREGVDAGAMLSRATALEDGAARAERLARAASRQIDAGVMESAEGRWRVTGRGWLLADGIAGELMRAVG